ncbi:DUF6081 family protein [Microbacterium sp.]|uniref:DUF6081 family protein n=1 Tax=Microbacterium sp. TaxID=51671 RepID=UPI0037C65036
MAENSGKPVDELLRESGFDGVHWQHLEYPGLGPDGIPWVCAERSARSTLADGKLSVTIDRFEIEHAIQPVDNCKHVLLSTETFEVPADGWLSASARVSAENINATPRDYRDGFATLILIEPSTGWVFDCGVTGDQVFAIHERLPLPDVTAFTRIVQDPLARVTRGPGEPHEFRMVLDAANRTATWFINDRLVFEASAVVIPARVNVGLGIFTLHPTDGEHSRSLHGQGIAASWEDIRIDTSR